MDNATLIAQFHPAYDSAIQKLYRDTYEGGSNFVRTYLIRRFNESDDAWKERLLLSYCPAFAKDAVEDYRRALVQRSSEIRRVGGNKNFLECCQGLHGGVDLLGSSMDQFIAEHVVGELMALGRVAIFVDNVSELGPTLADSNNFHPYLYTYKCEQILNWATERQEPSILKSILVRESAYEYNEFGLPYTYVEHRKLYQRTEDLVEVYNTATDSFIQKFVKRVKVTTFNTEGNLVSTNYLDLEYIPCVLVELKESILHEVADYQVTLLNIESSDAYYVWAANFPLYTEQRGPLDNKQLLERRSAPTESKDQTPSISNIFEQKRRNAVVDGDDTVQVGPIQGRTYAANSERPAWISPPTEPLMVSMQKEDRLKSDIRQLVALAIAANYSSESSAESKVVDRESSVESGLAGIGGRLAAAETMVARFWHLYLNEGDYSKVTYPSTYSLKSEKERREEAKELATLQTVVASKTYARETSKRIVTIMHSGAVPQAMFDKMVAEIDAANVPTADPETLVKDHEAGFVSTKTASMGRGYAEDEAEKAVADHVDRLKRIAESQGALNTDNAGARGVDDLAADPNEADDEKKESQSADKNAGGTKKVHGNYNTGQNKDLHGKSRGRRR